MSRMTILAAALAGAAALPAVAAPETIAVMEIAPATFVATAASANAFEIRSSELARTRAGHPELKAFAAQMIADHTAAGAALLAAAGDLPVPSALAPRHAGMIALLEGAEGPAFDMIYSDMQAGAHAEAVTLFATFAGHGADPALKAFAARTLPTLEGHKAHIDAITAMP